MKKLSLAFSIATGLVSILTTTDAQADFLYVGNVGSGSTSPNIEIITPNSSGAVFANTNLAGPHGLAFDSAGNLYVANITSSTIEKFSPTCKCRSSLLI
ncbi:MAG TPA: hypothetical protein VK815_10770 [Candidatus Acidoferrales bacterium]|nr:hypothetical protein [Candidatus Acidoferrales bacterium]